MVMQLLKRFNSVLEARLVLEPMLGSVSQWKSSRLCFCEKVSKVAVKAGS